MYWLALIYAQTILKVAHSENIEHRPVCIVGNGNWVLAVVISPESKKGNFRRNLLKANSFKQSYEGFLAFAKSVNSEEVQQVPTTTNFQAHDCIESVLCSGSSPTVPL